MQKNTMVWGGVIVLIIIVAVWLATRNTSDDAMMEGDTSMVPKEETMEQEESMTKDDAMMPSDESMQKDDAMMPSEEKMEKDGEAMMDNQTTARYVEYSSAVLDQAASGRRVLFFYANWCPSCRPADADFQKNIAQIPADTTVIRVNYNDPDTDQAEKDLAKKYGVTYQHTFIQIDKDGNVVTKWNGGQTAELLSNLK